MDTLKNVAWLKSKNGTRKFGIAIYRKEFPNTKKGWDSRWLVGSVYFKDEFFKVGIIDKPIFEKYEIKSLLKGLKKICRKSTGIAELKCLEPYVKFSIDIRKTGSGEITGEIWNVHPESTKLNFSFETDQTCVRQFYKTLRMIYKQV